MRKILNKLSVLAICALAISGCSLTDKISGKTNPEPEPKEITHRHIYGELISEKAPTCTEDGMKAHYECNECGKYFDANKNEVSKDSLTISKLGHLPGTAWHEEDGYHFHLCERCGHKVDLELHHLTEIPATAADHEHDGSILHYECDICGNIFLDSHGRVSIDHTVATLSGHDKELTYHPEVPATCENDGQKAYYSCSCGALFADAEGTKKLENPEKIPALGHISNGIWKFDGHKHWKVCFRCGEIIEEHEHIPGNDVYQDLTHTWKLCEICGHKVDIHEREFEGCHHERVMHFDGIEPTFTKRGHIEYWYCLDCNKCFYDAACTQEIENTEYGVNDKRDGRYLFPLTSSFNILNQNLRDYMNAKTDQEIIEALKNKDVYNYQARKMIMWEDNLNAPYKVEVSNSRMFESFKSYSSSVNAFTFEGTLTPGKTYYYRIKDASNNLLVDDLSFKVDDSYSLRTITVDGVSNFRDLGGWTAKDGHKVQYEKLYRGGELKVISQSTGVEQFLGSLGIKTEIDLRGDNPEKRITDPRLTYVNAPVWMYTSIIPDISITYPDGPTFNFEDYSIPSIKTIFEILADESNYPVYYHCSAGADRTGTISYLINGLLGVEYDDLCKDFELTSFSIFGDRYRSTPTEDGTFDDGGYYKNSDGNWMGFGKMNDIMMAFYGEEGQPLYRAIENYLKQVCEISDETIANVRRNLLGQDVNF